MVITPMMGDLSMVQAIVLIMVTLNRNIDFIFISSCWQLPSHVIQAINLVILINIDNINFIFILMIATTFPWSRRSGQ